MGDHNPVSVELDIRSLFKSWGELAGLQADPLLGFTLGVSRRRQQQTRSYGSGRPHSMSDGEGRIKSDKR